MATEFEPFTNRPYPAEITEVGSLNGRGTKITRTDLTDENLLREIRAKYGPDVSVSRVTVTGGVLREFPKTYAEACLVKARFNTQDDDKFNRYYYINPQCELQIYDFSVQVSPEHPLSDQRSEALSRSRESKCSLASIAFEDNQPILSYIEVQHCVKES